MFAGTAAWLAASAPAAAQPAISAPSATARSFNIPAQPLREALRQLMKQASLQIAFEGIDVDGKSSSAVSGNLSTGEALSRLLTGTGLTFRYLTAGSVVLERAPQSADGAVQLGPVRVEGAAEGGYYGPPQAQIGNLPVPFAGGQVARGARLGMLGNTDLMDAPFNVSSYTSQLIEDQQRRTVADVLANDPSVRNATTASAPGQYLLIRGLLSSETSIFFNGLAGMAPNNRSLTDMAERVELLKGPSAAISGMIPDGSVGGAVSIVAKRAEDQPLTRVSLDYTSRLQVGTRVDVGRRFGENDAWGIRVNAAYRGGDSNIRKRDQEGGLASVALDYRGERLRVAFDAYHQWDERDGTDYYVGFTSNPSAVPKASNPMTLGDTAEAKDTMAMGRLEYDLTPQVTVFAALGTHTYRSEWVYANLFAMAPDGSGDVYSGSYRSEADIRSGEAGLRANLLTGPVSHRFSLVATDFKRTSYYGSIGGATLPTSIFDPVTIPNPGDSGKNPPESDSSHLQSVALTDTLGMWDERVLLTLGLRYQRVWSESVWDDAPYEESAVSPLAAIVFKPSQDVSIYANYIQGLSQGPVAPRGMTPELDNAGEVFPPYKTKQYEMGIKGEWSGFGSSLSLFQIAQPNSLTVESRFTVDGEQRNRGLEWNVYGTLGAGVRVLGGVTLIDAKITKAAGATQGKEAFGVPNAQVNLGGEWDVPGTGGLTLSGRFLYTDSVYIDSANVYSIPSWTSWDVGARYETQIADKPVVLRANVENLFNKSYWIGYRQGWRSGFVSRSAPRTVMLSVTTDF
jgi:iron complex outermembrane receptor protein